MKLRIGNSGPACGLKEELPEQNVRGVSLQEMVLLEFQGAFDQPEKLEMELDANNMLFASSTLEGKELPHPRTLVLKKEGEELVCIGVVRKKILFDRPPRYKRKTAK